ncbi:MAG: ABC transporter permease [Burkholderiaceae bacterium]
MDLQTFIQLIVSGLTIGCVYSLVGLGFALTLRATDLINFAQGEMVMLGALIGYTLLATMGSPFVVAFAVATIGTGVVGVLLERVILRPMLRRKAPLLNLLIATLGMSVALQAFAIIIWGREPIPYPSIFGQGITVFGIAVQPLNLWIMGLGFALMAGLHLFFKKTLVGISWRAASLDPSTAALYGVDRTTNVALTFGISAGLGGAAGVLIAPLFFASFGLGHTVLIKAFAAAAIGGFGIVGTMVGGLVVGVIETLAAGTLSSEYKNVIMYGMLLVVLMVFFRPSVPAGRSITEGSKIIVASDIAALVSGVPRPVKLAVLAVAAVAWGTFPLLADAYVLRIVNLATILAIAALGLQLIVGYTGQFSFGHAAFYGVGAYASALLVLKLKVPFVVALPCATLAAALAGLLVAPVLRLSGHYLAIATLAVGEIVFVLMINWKGLTNGAYGVYGIPMPDIGPLKIDSDEKFFMLASALLALIYFIAVRLVRSRFGRALVAVRENELAATAAGINPLRQKGAAFIYGSAAAGVAGALYAHYSSYISPEFFSFNTSLQMVVMVVIGGLGSMPGAIIGALVVTLLPEFLRAFADYRLVIYGCLIIVFMLFLPGGLADVGRRSIRFATRRRPAARGD